MKNNNLLSIFICIFGLSLHATHSSHHTMQDYRKAFSIDSLRANIIDDDDELFRDFFPQDAFNVHNSDLEDADEKMSKYFSENLPFRLYNEAYLHMYRKIRKNSIILLENELLSTYFRLHELLIDTVIFPIIESVYPYGELGPLAHPKSQIRLMMQSYIEYLHHLLKQPNTVADESESYDHHLSLVYHNFIDNSPSWFSDDLTHALAANFDEFDNIYLSINILKHLIKERISSNWVGGQIKEQLNQYGFIVPLEDVLAKLVPKEHLPQIGAKFVKILKEFYKLDPKSRRDDLSIIILHCNFAKKLLESQNIFITKNEQSMFSIKNRDKFVLNKKKLRNLLKKYSKTFQLYALIAFNLKAI